MSLRSLMIRASAGSGKTYQLANRFLALLAIGVEPSRVIALTFTRKAAGEFADRILHRLAHGAASDDGAAALAADICLTLRGDQGIGQPGLLPAGAALPDLTREVFLRLLEKLVGSLDRLALGTFDGFFARIARTSCYELGLGGFALLDEAELRAEKERTFARIFSRLSGSTGERDDFLQAFKQATFGREEARFVRMLEDFIDAHHLRYLAQPDAAAWGGEDRLWPEGAPWPVPSDFAAKAEETRAASEGIAWGHGTWGNSWNKMLDWFADYHPGQGGKEPSTLEKLLRRLDDLAGGTAVFDFSGKQIRVPNPASAVAAELAGGYLVAEIRLCLKQTRGMHAVMERYEAMYGRDVRRRGKLGFADLTMVLAMSDIGGSGFGQNIGYRIDQWFDHWMLDEFQDTNRPQWSVLSGLVQEVQQDDEGKRTFFVVGDPKQGIHAWRGGEPRLFDEIAGDWQDRLPEWSMQKSWRSAGEVLELVNQVCDPARPCMTDRFPRAALDRWKFAAHEAGRAGLRGESLVLEVPGPVPDDDASDEAEPVEGKPTWEGVAAIIREYQPLARGLSCAVLVASNATARAIADFLRRQLPGMPIEVDTETPMAADGPVGAALFDLFRWLHAPADGLAQGHLVYSPMRAALSLATGKDSPWAQWEAARAMVAAGGMSGFFDLLAPAIRSVHGLDAFNAWRLESWQLKARQFDEGGGAMADWLRQLEAWKLRESSRAGAIQIMTVHKAKGLEFDLVILPDLAGKAFDDAGRRDLLVSQGHGGRADFLCLSPRKAIAEAEPALAAMADQWAADQCYERFCNLYVAMTRAVHALFVLFPEPRATKGKASAEMKPKYEDWVRDAVAGAPATPREFAPDGLSLRTLWACGDSGWLNAYPVKAASLAGQAGSPALLPPNLRPRRRTPSGEKLDKAKKAGNASRDRRGAMDFGSAVHAAFEAVAWLGDAPAPAGEMAVDIEETVPGVPVPTGLPEEVGKLVAKCLAAPAIRALFTRPTGEVELWREQPFDVLDDGCWTSGVIDRIHIIRKEGRAVAATIIDYKTDHIGDADELLPRYAKQMEAYREAIARILGLEAGSITCTLVSTCLAAVVDVPHA